MTLPPPGGGSYHGYVRWPFTLALALTGCGFTPGRLAASTDGGATSDADALATDGPPLDAAVRVSDGLVALYTFEEGAGTTVVDRSGVGTALDLTIANPTNVTWGDGTLTIVTDTLVASPAVATKVLDACRAADAMTLEAWITPSVVGGFFPRVVTLSASNNDLAATLMAIDSHFEFRMLGPMTDANGLPSLNTPDNTVALMAIHVALVSEPGGMRRTYVDGVERATDGRGGDLASWGTQHRLGLGNEIDGGRPWLGTFDLVAIYSRALTASEIAQNRTAGPR